MCRYAIKRYKDHYVCFDCRKSFKQTSLEDLIESNGDWQKYQKAYLSSPQNRKKFRDGNSEVVAYFEKNYFNRIHKCPDCGSEMKNVGLDFKTPKKGKIEEWNILASLYDFGKFFYTCGCDAYGFIPKDKNQYKKHLLEMRENYQKRLSERDAEMPQDDLQSYLEYWTEKLSLVDK